MSSHRFVTANSDQLEPLRFRVYEAPYEKAVTSYRTPRELVFVKSRQAKAYRTVGMILKKSIIVDEEYLSDLILARQTQF